MLIKRVNACGMERIYEGYSYCFKENRGGFGHDFFRFLSHATITIEVDDLSTIELFYLKKLASAVQIIDSTFKNFVDEEEIELHQKVDVLLEVHDEALNDEDIDKEKYSITNILPIGCERYSVMAIFKGSNITAITGTLMESVFYVDNRFPSKYPSNEYVEEKLAGMFFKSLYTYISDEMTSLDIVTQFMLNKKIYQYAEKDVNVAFVNSPVGEISFFGNNSENLNKQLSTIHEKKQIVPYYLPDQITITFAMNTTFRTFFKLFMSTNIITDYNNLKLLFIDPEIMISEPIMQKYKARISNGIDFINSYKKSLNESTNVDLNKFNYIYNGTRMVYSVQMTLQDIENIKEILKDEEEFLHISESMEALGNMIKTIFI